MCCTRHIAFIPLRILSKTMTVRRETESILALADEVIASIEGCGDKGTRRLPDNEGFVVRLDRHLLTKHCQVDREVYNKEVQHFLPVSSIGLQCTQQVANRGSQVMVSNHSSATQTEPDVIIFLLKEAVKETIHMSNKRSTQAVRMLECLGTRVDRCNAIVRGLMSQLVELETSRGLLQKRLEDARCTSSFDSLMKLEVEARSLICEEEHALRYEEVMIAFHSMQNLPKECEPVQGVEDFTTFPEHLQKHGVLQTCNNADGNGCAGCHPGDVFVGERDDRYREMEELLSECLAVLGMDA